MINVSEYLNRFQDFIVVECSGLNMKDEKWHFRNCTLLHLAVFHVAFGHFCI